MIIKIDGLVMGAAIIIKWVNIDNRRYLDTSTGNDTSPTC